MFLPGLNFILILKEYFIWWVMTYRTSSFLRFEHVIDSLDRTGNTVLLLFWNLKKLTDVRCLPGCFYQMISKNLLRAKFSLLTYSKIWGERYKWCRECHESAWAGGVQVLIIRLAVFFKKPFLSLAHCEVYLDKKKKAYYFESNREKNGFSNWNSTQFFVGTGSNVSQELSC